MSAPFVVYLSVDASPTASSPCLLPRRMARAAQWYYTFRVQDMSLNRLIMLLPRFLIMGLGWMGSYRTHKPALAMAIVFSWLNHTR